MNQETALETPLKDEPTLQDVLQFELPALFRWQHLNRDVLIGFVGDRGGGKSLGGGLVCLLDYMLQGEPCFSNMQLKANLEIDNDVASKYGLKSGPVSFEAQPLDKYKFLRFDPCYRGGVFFTHEFNIWLADARRSNTTLNLQTDDVGQELRKLEMAWVYDCIHEMFVDLRIRDATDIFIDTRDTALSPTGMARKQPQGIEFEWWVYCMSQKGAAIMRSERYRDSHKPLGPYYVRGKQLWGLIDTQKRERREKYRPQLGEVPVDLETAMSPELTTAVSKWAWLYEKIKDLHNQVRCGEAGPKIEDEVLWGYLQLKERSISPVAVGRQLKWMGIQNEAGRRGHRNYIIDMFDLKDFQSLEKKEYILAPT